MAWMKYVLLMSVVVMGQFVLAADKRPQVIPNSPKAKAAIEAAIRGIAKKPEDKLTKAQIDQLQKALSECRILSNGKKSGVQVNTHPLKSIPIRKRPTQ